MHTAAVLQVTASNQRWLLALAVSHYFSCNKLALQHFVTLFSYTTEATITAATPSRAAPAM